MKSSLLTFTISFLIPAACVYFFAFTSLDKIESLNQELDYYKNIPGTKNIPGSGIETAVITKPGDPGVPVETRPQEEAPANPLDKKDTVWVQLPAPPPEVIEKVVFDTAGFAALEQFRNKYNRIVSSYNKANVSMRDSIKFRQRILVWFYNEVREVVEN